MKTCVFPGTFDPFTKGHLDLVTRAKKMFDKVIVAVSDDRAKCAFSQEERILLAQKSVQDIEGVEVIGFSGLLVTLCQSLGVYSVLRGLRNAVDLEYERTLTAVYKEQDASIETVYLLCDPKLTHVEASIVRDLLRYGCDVSNYVAPAVAEWVKNK